MSDSLCQLPAFPERDYVVPDYSPSWQNLRNHEIMESFRENRWDVNEKSYNEGVLMVGLAFAGMGVVLILSTTVFNLILDHCTGCCHKERQRTPRNSVVKYAYMAALVLVFLGVLCAALGFVGIDETLDDLEGETRHISHNLKQGLEVTTTAVAHTREGLQYSLDLASGLVQCDFPDPVVSNLTALISGVIGVGLDHLSDNLGIILNSTIGDLADNVEDIADTVAETSPYRRAFFWLIFGLEMLCTAVFVYLGMMHFFYGDPPPAPPMKRYGSVKQLHTERAQRWEGAAAAAPVAPSSGEEGQEQDRGRPPKRTHRVATCMGCCTWPAAMALIFLSWVIVAGSMALAVFSADFCMQPDENTYKVVDGPLVVFYVDGCRNLDTLTNASNSPVLAVQEGLDDLAEAAVAGCNAITQIGDNCTAVETPADNLGGQMVLIAQDIIAISDVISCEAINGIYTNIIYGEVCTDLSKSLYAVWVGSMLAGLAIIGVMMLWRILMEQRNNLWHNQMEQDAADGKASAVTVPGTGFNRAPPAGPDDLDESSNYSN